MMKLSRTGIVLVVVGIFLLLSSYNIFFLNLSRDWPWLLIIGGLFILFKRDKKTHGKRVRFLNSNVRIEILNKIKNGEMSIEEGMEKLYSTKEEI